MPCYYPLKGWRSATPNPQTGKRSIVFRLSEGLVDMPVDVPCGQCVGCRLERSRQWAIRCHHEAQLHDDNCFITLTYSTDNLPADGSLQLKHWQDFMKRFRKRISIYEGKGEDRKLINPIKFFHCGEYGERYQRPHYHACIFGYDFPDKYLFKTTDAGSRLYRSDLLESLWTFGYSTIGNVTFESAAYVARYIMKKITGDRAEEHYQGRRPEYTTMSRNPGIGSKWFEQFGSDVYPADEVVLRGKKMRPPRFYDSLYEVDNPDEFEEIKAARVKSARRHKWNQSGDRLRVREAVKIAQISSLKRKGDYHDD